MNIFQINKHWWEYYHKLAIICPLQTNAFPSLLPSPPLPSQALTYFTPFGECLPGVLFSESFLLRPVHMEPLANLISTQGFVYGGLHVLVYLTIAHKVSRVWCPGTNCWYSIWWCTGSTYPPSWNISWVAPEEYLSPSHCVNALNVLNWAIPRNTGYPTVDWREMIHWQCAT